MTHAIGILHYSAPPIIGGVESVIAHHARLFAEAHFDVSIFAGRGASFDPRIRVQIIPEMDSRHPRVLAIGQMLAHGKVPEDFYILREELKAALRPLLASLHVAIGHNVATLHKNLPLTAALYDLVVGEQRVSFIAYVHDLAWKDPLYLPELHEGYPWDLLRIPWPGVRYVTISRHRQQWIQELMGLSPDDVPVVYPGISLFEFLEIGDLARQLVSKLHLLDHWPLFLYPTRITRRKNIEGSLLIIAELRRAFPTCALILTGPPGPHNPKNQAYLEELLELRRTLDLEEHVYFLYEYGEDGNPLLLPDEAVRDFYRLCDVLLFPSRREGFGIPLLEAGILRMPVFASRLAPFEEIAGEYIHYFDPDEPPAQIANRIVTILQKDPALTLRKRVTEHFTYEKTFYRDLLPLVRASMHTKPTPS